MVFQKWSPVGSQSTDLSSPVVKGVTLAKSDAQALLRRHNRYAIVLLDRHVGSIAETWRHLNALLLSSNFKRLFQALRVISESAVPRGLENSTHPCILWGREKGAKFLGKIRNE